MCFARPAAMVLLFAVTSAEMMAPQHASAQTEVTPAPSPRKAPEKSRGVTAPPERNRPAPAIDSKAPDAKERSLQRALRDIQSLLRLGRFDEALAAIDKLPPEQQSDPQIVLARGMALRKLGRLADAEKLYRDEVERLEARRENPIAMRMELERVVRDQKKTKDAFEICLEIDRQGGGATDWVRDEMQSLIEADSLGDVAVAILREEIDERPEAKHLGDLLVQALLFLGRDEDALAEASRLDRDRGDRGGTLLDVARVLEEKGMDSQAVAFADAAVRAGIAKDRLQEGQLVRARSLRRLRRAQEAAAACEQAANASPQGPMAVLALQTRAEILHRDLRDLPAAESALQDLIASLERSTSREKDRLLSRSLVALADIHLGQGRYEDAAAVYQRVENAAADPTSKEEAVFQQAEVLFYSGRKDEAAERYQRIVSEFPGGDRVNDALDRILLITRIADADPMHFAALGQVAYQRRVAAPARALALCQEAARSCDRCPAEEDLLREEGLLLLDLGRIDDASVRADTLASRYGDSASAPHLLRAVADAMLGRDGPTDAVLKRYEDLLRLFPKSHEAFEARSALQKMRQTGGAIQLRSPAGEGRDRG